MSTDDTAIDPGGAPSLGACAGHSGPSARRQELAEAFLDLLPRLRRRIQARLPRDLREELAAVTPHQLEALMAITGCGGLGMNDLARIQQVSLSSCTALADRLVRQGLVERANHPGDRRIVRLVPTERGRDFVARFRAAKRAWAVAALSALDDEELVTFVALVRKIAAVPPDASGEAERSGAAGGELRRDAAGADAGAAVSAGHDGGGRCAAVEAGA